MSLKNTFRASVVYQLHSNPAILGLRSEELGYTQIALADLALSQQELDALGAATEVRGTYEAVKNPQPTYFQVPLQGWQPMTWKVTSLKPA